MLLGNRHEVVSRNRRKQAYNQFYADAALEACGPTHDYASEVRRKEDFV